MTSYIPPQPNPHVEQRVRGELQKIDPLLDIKWQPAWAANEAAGTLEGRYVLVCYWPQNDKRWAMVQEQREDTEPYDILGLFGQDPGQYSSIPESPDQVLELVVERLASCDAERLPHTVRMQQIHEHNLRQRRMTRDEMQDELVEAALEARTGVYKPPMVSVGIELTGEG